MGLGVEFLNILKDSVKLTDSVERLNNAVAGLTNDVQTIDKRLVRLETLVEVAQFQRNSKKLDK